jgi:peptide/nickel transport system permease protein
MSSDRTAYLIRRLVWAVLVIFFVSTLVFLVVRLVPGDPVESILGEHATNADKEVLAECLHVNDSFLTQYGYFLGDIANGTLGTFCDNPDVTVVGRLKEGIPYTFELALASMLIGLLIAIPLGVLAALKQSTWVDFTALTIAMLGVSIPSFWLGPMLLLFFSIGLRVFPDPGAGIAGLSSLALPAITLGTALSAKLTRMIRASMLEVLSADYVRTARAKGLRERVVVLKHAMRNAMVPVVTVLGLQIGALLSGAIIVEKIFARPGLGFMLLDAIEQRNYALVQGAVLVIAFMYVIVNLLTDLAYMGVDPRISLEAKKR